MSKAILFLAAVLTALLAAHYLLYRTFAQGLAGSARSARLLFLATPLLLTASFVLSAVLHRHYQHALTALYSVAACIWIGLFIHLLLAVGALWGIRGAVALAGGRMAGRTLCISALAAAVLASLWGVWNARRPRLTTLAVRIAGLPEPWQGETVVQLSDLHLGSIRGPAYLRQVVRRVNALRPALVLITGDLFDGMAGDLSPFVEPLSAFEAAAGVFFVTGNHEGYLGLLRPLATLSKTPIRVLDDEVVEVAGLQIVGASFPEHRRRDGDRSRRTLAEQIDPSRPSILMYHTPTDLLRAPENRGKQQTRTYLSADVSFSFAKQHGIDLQLSGHTHQGQLFPFTLLTRRIFRGYDYGLHRDGRFHLYTTSGTGTWGPPMRTASRSEIVAIELL